MVRTMDAPNRNAWLPPRLALAVSLAAIAVAWAWTIARAGTGVELPQHFSELAWRVARNKLLILGGLAVLLRLAGEGGEALGLRRAGWRRQVALGLGIGAVMFLFFNVALTSVLQGLFPTSSAPRRSVMAFFADPANLLVWLPIGILGGGLVEELERIFVITRFERWLGRAGLWLGIAASSVVFGLAHLYQGPGAALSTGVSGFVLALVYLRRRAALEPIVAHATADVLAILAATFLVH